MTTAIVVLGGVGLFLLGMTIMTDGLKALAGSALRTVLSKAAATPLSGALWGSIVTLLVQSSSAVTMTTIGLVSDGLLTFPQGLGLQFDPRAANLCIGAMRAVETVCRSITAEKALSGEAGSISWTLTPEIAAALAALKEKAALLDDLQRDDRATTLASVASGMATAADAFARIDAIRQLDLVTHHAWRAAEHLLGRPAV